MKAPLLPQGRRAAEVRYSAVVVCFVVFVVCLATKLIGRSISLTSYEIICQLCGHLKPGCLIALFTKGLHTLTETQGKWRCWKLSLQRCDSLATFRFVRRSWGCRWKLFYLVVDSQHGRFPSRLIWNGLKQLNRYMRKPTMWLCITRRLGSE